MNLNRLAEIINANKRYFRVTVPKSYFNEPVLMAKIEGNELHLMTTFQGGRYKNQDVMLTSIQARDILEFIESGNKTAEANRSIADLKRKYNQKLRTSSPQEDSLRDNRATSGSSRHQDASLSHQKPQSS